MSRVFCLGDLHGAHKALVQCLERAKFDKDSDTLIQLGDVADGWPDVYECVEELISIKNLIPIRGNHDYWTLTWMEMGIPEHGHRGQGGESTMMSYRNCSDCMSNFPNHYKFFKYQHDYYIDENNRLFVHGGIYPQHPIKEGNNIHNYCWNRSMWMKACEYNDYKNDGLRLDFVDNFKEVFIGHTTTVNWGTDKPMNRDIIWNLDTGAGFKGKLTIMDVNTKEYWQSDPVQELYPDVVGRSGGFKPK